MKFSSIQEEGAKKSPLLRAWAKDLFRPERGGQTLMLEERVKQRRELKAQLGTVPLPKRLCAAVKNHLLYMMIGFQYCRYLFNKQAALGVACRPCSSLDVRIILEQYFVVLRLKGVHQ